MSFLPVVQRELRVAARKPITFRLRLGAALVAAVLLAGFFAFSQLVPFALVFKANVGRHLFSVLAWLSLSAGSLAGLFFTSDCLSEEKREGTIGFLFLTNLRGYDVVLGKLMATSLRAFYALLAIFPVLGVALLMGGVSGMQFWRTALALVNGLIVSLAAGLFISSLSRRSQKAFIGTLALIVGWIGLGPLLDADLAAAGQRAFSPTLSLWSPGYLLAQAGAWGASPFWVCLVLNQLTAWLLLAATCLVLPRVWQDKRSEFAMKSTSWSYAWRFGSVRSRRRRRVGLLGPHPVAWLVSRERWQMTVGWCAALLLMLLLAMLAVSHGPAVWSVLWSPLSGAVTLLLYLGVSAYAVRFGVEAKGNGMLELLLVSPLTLRQILHGQWRAFAALFALPVALCLMAQTAGTFLVQTQQWKALSASASPTVANASSPKSTSITVTVPTAGSSSAAPAAVGGLFHPSSGVLLGASLLGAVTTAADLVAVMWFGMWMGLTSQKANLAILRTLLFVELIPWFVIAFGSAVFVAVLLSSLAFRKMGAGGPPAWSMTWTPLLMGGLAMALSLAKDIGFSLWARQKLYREFRRRAIAHLTPSGDGAVLLPPVIRPL